MRPTSFLAFIALSAVVFGAEETTPQAKEQRAKASSADKAAASSYDGPTVAAFQVLRFQTKTSLATLTKFLKDHESDLQKMSDRDRDEFFAKHLQLAEANTLRPTGSSAFATVAQSQPSKDGSRSDDKRSMRGPPPEVRAKYEKLSDQAKEKVRRLFADNRKKLSEMNEGERRKFMETSFNAIAAEDEKSKKAK